MISININETLGTIIGILICVYLVLKITNRLKK